MPIKSFSPEARAEALQLLKDGHSQKEIADQVGCSIASLQSWKRQARGKKNGKKKTKSGKRAAAVEAECTCECCCCIPFEEFVHGYWTQYPKAGEVLKLPPDMMPEAVKYVNNVLKYAYENLK